jgi:predicted ATPase/DNA-binding winged helix-turn-helix (wHTH) protein
MATWRGRADLSNWLLLERSKMSLPPLAGTIVAFSRFWLVRDSRLLIGDGTVVEISVRAFDTLATLVANAGKVVSTAELREAVWGSGANVDINAIHAQISAVRRALDDERTLVVTVPGRGYRFTAQTRDIHTADSGPGADLGPAQSSGARMQADLEAAMQAESQAALDALQVVSGFDQQADASPAPRKPSKENKVASRARAVPAQAAFGSHASSSPESWMRNQNVDAAQFVGRRAELSELLGVVLAERVTTLTGAAGIGKTRLAIETALRLAPYFPDGTLWAPFSALSLPIRVVDAIAIALGIEPNTEHLDLETLAARIGERRVLLVVDHCDHLIDATSRAIESLIAGAHGLHVLVTCEKPLSVVGERVIAITPLGSPAAPALSFEPLQSAPPLRPLVSVHDDSPSHLPLHDWQALRRADLLSFDAMRLLLRRISHGLDALPGAQALVRFTPSSLSSTALDAAALICWRLDGMPLAIELAAASIVRRARDEATFMRDFAPLCAYAADLDSAMTRRVGVPRIVLPRAAMVPAMIELSVCALEPDAQTALRRLGIFASAIPMQSALRLLAAFGGWREGNDEARVQTLVDAALLQWVDCNGEPRLRLPSPVRYYALACLDRLGERATASAYHASEIARMMSQRFGTGLVSASAQSRHDIDDLRAALEWSVSEGKFEICADLLDQTAPIWIALSLVDEYVAWVRAALARVESGSRRPIRDEMRLLAALARALAKQRGVTAELLATWERAYELATACADTPYRLRALFTLAMHALQAGEATRCRQLQAAFSDIASAANVPAASLNARRLDGVLRAYAGDPRGAVEVLSSIVDGSWASGDKTAAGTVVHEANQMATGFGVSLHLLARAMLAVARWTTGELCTAESLRDACQDPDDGSEPLAACFALSFACALASLDGNAALTEYFAVALVDRARAIGLNHLVRAGLDFQLWKEARNGNRQTALRLVKGALQRIGRQRVYIVDIALISTLLPMVDIGDDPALGAEMIAPVRVAIDRGDRTGERWHLPELLRVEAVLRLAQGEAPNDVERALVGARQMARSQGSVRIEQLIDGDLGRVARAQLMVSGVTRRRERSAN